MLSRWGHHQADGNRGGLYVRDSVTRCTEQLVPTLPHEEPHVGPIEKAFVVLRKSPEEDVSPKPEIPAVRQRGDHHSTRCEYVSYLAKKGIGGPKVLQNVGTDYILKASLERRQPPFEVSAYQPDVRGELGRIKTALPFYSGHLIPALGQDRSEIAVGATDVKYTSALSFRRQGREQAGMTAPRTGFVSID